MAINGLPIVHPGEMLKDDLDELGISMNAFAQALSVPPNRITAIIKGQRSITAETAIALSEFFGTTPDLWVNMQANYDLRVAEKAKGKAIRKAVKRGEPARSAA